MSLDAATEPIAVDAEHVQTLIAREEKRFRAARSRSDELWREARKVSPRGVPSSHQDAPPQPVFVDGGLGSRVEDEQRSVLVSDLFGALEVADVGGQDRGDDRPGGASERFGVQPDIVALANAIGGGLPCGAIGGREDVFVLIDEKRVAQMGTFNGNPLTIAASKVTLDEILTPAAHARFDVLAEILQGGLEGAIAEYRLPFHVTTMAARGGIAYRTERVRNYRDYLQIDKSVPYLAWLYQCIRGVLMAPGAEENWTLSVQHSEEDVQRYVDNFSEMGRDLREGS